VSAYQETGVRKVTAAAVALTAILAYRERKAIQAHPGALASLDRQGRREETELRERKAIPAYLVNVCFCLIFNKKLSYRQGTARYVVSIEIFPIATQQCTNYLYNKS